MLLSDVLYVPDISAGVFSVSAAINSGAEEVRFYEGKVMLFTKDQRSIQIGRRMGSMYGTMLRRANVDIQGALSARVMSSVEQTQESRIVPLQQDLWHRRLGHVGKFAIEDAIKNSTVRIFQTPGWFRAVIYLRRFYRRRSTAIQFSLVFCSPSIDCCTS